MQLDTFVLCDAATEGAGKLNILGQFDTVYATRIPAVHPAMTVALRTRFARSEVGEHPFSLRIIDADGNSVIPPLQGSVAVTVQENEDYSVSHLLLNLNGTQFLRYGAYSVDLSFDGKQLASIPFYVKQPRNRKAN